MKEKIAIGFWTGVLLGPSFSYGSIYFYHLILFFCIIFIFSKQTYQEQIKKIILRPLNLILLAILIFYVISLLWADNIKVGINYIIIYCVGLSVVYIGQFFLQEDHMKKSFLNKFLPISVLSVLIISLLEIFTSFRLPISSLSNYNEMFGRENILSDILELENIIGYNLSSPTAFFWNPNNLAVFIGLFIPILLKINKTYSYILFIISVIVIVYTASRFSLISLGLVLLIFSFVKVRMLFYFLTLNLVLIIPMLLFSDSIYNIKANEPILKITNHDLLTSLNGNSKLYKNKVIDETDNSQGIRKQLYIQGWEYIVKSKFLGVGAGNADWLNLKQSENTQDITNVHFYWLEIFINGGLFVILLMTVFFGNIVLSLIKKLKNDSNSLALLMSLVLFGLSVISISTAHYFLPYYGFLAILINYKYSTIEQ